MQLIKTTVYDSYWVFAYRRQKIFENTYRGLPPHHNIDDLILKEYKFTNAYRAADRVSQYLINNVIYKDASDDEEILFKILLFKIFNSIPTWELLQTTLMPKKWSRLCADDIDRVLMDARNRGKKIYSAAYIMPSGTTSFGSNIKHRNHLALLESIMSDDPVRKIKEMASLKELFEYFRSKPMMGNFLAYQIAIDINYSEIANFDESEFIVAGPGAKSGIRKCFYGVRDGQEAEIIEYMRLSQHEEFQKRNIQFPYLFGRDLQLIDIQNLFCEVDKYARLAHPEVIGLGARSRIKQKYKPTLNPIKFSFPPKWGLCVPSY